MKLFRWRCLGVFLLLIPLHSLAEASSILRVQDGHFVLGNAPFRNIGVTIPDLLDRFLKGQDSSAEKALEDAKAVRARFVRCSGLPTDPLLLERVRVHPQELFRGYEALLAALQKNDLLLVPSLLWNGEGVVEVAQEQSQGLRALLTPNSNANRLALELIKRIVTQYRANTRVLFWEIGSELDRDADLLAPGDPQAYSSDMLSASLQQMAFLIHHLDKNHLVCSGNGCPRPDAWHLYESRRKGFTAPAGAPQPLDTLFQFRDILQLRNPPGIDIISVHLQPPGEATPLWLTRDDTQALTLPWIERVCLDLGRPLFLGAFGQVVQQNGKEVAAPWLLNCLERLQITDAPLAAVQEWEPAIPSPFTLSLQATSKMAVALKTANAFIADTVARHIDVGLPPKLFATQTVVENDRLHSIALRLQNIVLPLLQAARIPPDGKMGWLQNHTGVALYEPYVGAARFRVADLALMATSGYVPLRDIESWVRLEAKLQNGPKPISLSAREVVPPYSVPDWIAPDGTAIWFPEQPNNASIGEEAVPLLPPADAPFWFLLLVHAAVTQGADVKFLRARMHTGAGELPLWQICEKAFESVEGDKATGLIQIEGGVRADWVYADHVKKAGACLVPSLLRLQAAENMETIFEAMDDVVRARAYQTIADQIRAELVRTFYVPLGQEDGQDVGLLLSATQLGRREDVWGEAMALFMQALPPDTANAISRHLGQLFKSGEITIEGYVRPLPVSGNYGGVWESAFGEGGLAQTEGYWGFPVGWLAVAMALTKRQTAVELLQAYVDSVEKERVLGAPWAWRTAKETFGASCSLSVALPAGSMLAGLNSFLAETP